MPIQGALLPLKGGQVASQDLIDASVAESRGS